jgi:NTF2-related export protein 1/2
MTRGRTENMLDILPVDKLYKALMGGIFIADVRPNTQNPEGYPSSGIPYGEPFCGGGDKSFDRRYDDYLPARCARANKCYVAAAREFIESYYKALNDKSARATLSSFYIQPTPANPLVADISLNGNVVPTPADLQTLFESQIPNAHYEAQCFDCHVLNPNFNIGASDVELGPDPTGRKMSVLLVVSGYVKYGDPRSAKMRGFTENFVLVPNFLGATGKDGGVKGWLIQSQNFRIVL